MLVTMSGLLRIFGFVCAFSDNVFYYLEACVSLKPRLVILLIMRSRHLLFCFWDSNDMEW